MVWLDGLMERSDYATWGVQWAAQQLNTACIMNLLATPIMIVATVMKPDDNRVLVSWFPCEVLFFWTFLFLILYNLRKRHFDRVRIHCLSFMLVEYTAIFLVWSYFGRVPARYSRLLHSFDWALLPLSNGLQLAVVRLQPVPRAVLLLFSMGVRTCLHMRVFKSSLAVALFKASLANGFGHLLAGTIERYKRAAYERHLKQSKDGDSTTAHADAEVLPPQPSPTLLQQMVRLDGLMESSEYAAWGVSWASQLLSKWCILFLLAMPYQIIATCFKPDSNRALVSWSPCLYLGVIPAFILYSLKRRQFDLVRPSFLAFILLAGLGDLVWSYVGRVPDIYTRVERDFDWALVPITFGLQLAVVKLRFWATNLLVLFSMGVRTCLHMRVFKSSAAVALFKAALANGLGLLFARAIEKAMLRSFEQHVAKKSKSGHGEANSLRPQRSFQRQLSPTPQQQQQQQQQQQLVADELEHIQSNDAVLRAMQTARSTYKRLKRVQVDIVIHGNIMPEDLSNDIAEMLSQEISLRMPGSMVFNMAARRGCVIVSFTLRCSEEPPAATSVVVDSGPNDSTHHSVKQPAQQQQQQQQQPDHARVEAVKSTVLQWLVASGLSAKLTQDACVNLQVDGHVAECKWVAQRAVWEAGRVVPMECQQHTSMPPSNREISAAAARPKLSLPCPVAVLLPAPSQQQQQQQQQQQHVEQPVPASTHVRLTASLHNVGGRPLIGWGNADVHGLMHGHANGTADPAADEGAAATTPFSLLARSNDRFLPVAVSELQRDADAIGHAVGRQVVEAIIQLPADLANTTTPIAIELELWESHTCLANHPVLLMPDSLNGVAQELGHEWAVVGDALKQQKRLLEQLPIAEQQDQHQMFQERQAAVWEGMLAYLQDLADFLHFWRAEQEGHKQPPQQVALTDAMGADLLHHANMSSMPELARLLSSRPTASTKPPPGVPAPHVRDTQALAAVDAQSTPAAQQLSMSPSTSITTAADVWPSVDQPGQLTLPTKALLAHADATSSEPLTTQVADALVSFKAISAKKKELHSCNSALPIAASRQYSGGSSVTASSVSSKHCVDSRRSSVSCRKPSEEAWEREAQLAQASVSPWGHLVQATAHLQAWLLRQAKFIWAKLTTILNPVRESLIQDRDACTEKKNA